MACRNLPILCSFTKLLAGFLIVFLSERAVGDIINDLDEISDQKKQTAPKSQEKPKDLTTEKAEKPSRDNKKKSAVKKKPSGKTQSDDERRKQPIHLKSDREAIYSRHSGVVHLVENVRISQGNLFFRADEAKAYFVEVGDESVVEKVEIYGNVRIAKYSPDPTENIKASGKRAIFLNSIGLVTLIGNARLWQGGHLIKGKQITYELSSGIIKVDRAEGILQPEDQKQ